MADITFTCPNCKSEIEADESLGGGTAQCPNCNNTIMIPMPGIKAGMVIAGFRVERRLGSGGMGEVWLAHQVAMERKVALKILSPALTSDEEFVTRFMQEVKMAGKLEHPNIVTAFDAGVDSGIYYLAISFVDGVELGDRLVIDKIIPEKEALEIILDIAEALRYAWNKFKILHRDIKPANIMITKDSGAKLMDMGISKSLAEESNLTMTGMIVGTPYYMSPEQAMAQEELDFRADVYSLGATFYHMVTGEKPYDAATAMGVLTKHITEPLPDPRGINPELSEECASLLEIMMAKKKENRHASWEALIRDIELVMDGKTPGTQVPGPGQSVIMTTPSRALSRRRVAQKPPMAKMPLADGAEIFEEQEKGRSKISYAVIVALLLLVIAGAFYFLLRQMNKQFVLVDGGKVPVRVAAGEDRKKNRPETPLDELSRIPGVSAGGAGGVHRGGDGKPDEEPAVYEGRFEPELNASEPGTLSDERKLEIWNSALDFSRKNPGKYQESIDRFERVSKQLSGTKYCDMAAEHVRKLEEARASEAEKIIEQLKKDAEPFLQRKEYDSASDIFSTYSGRLADATKQERKRIADAFSAKAEELEREKQEREEAERLKYDNFMNELAGDIVKTRFDDALKLLSRKENSQYNTGKLKNSLEKLSDLSRTIAASFENETGKVITLSTVKGPQKGTLRKVKSGKIYLQKKIGNSSSYIINKIPFKELLIGERQKRISRVDPLAGSLFGAVCCIRGRKFDVAGRFIKNCGIISGYLENQLVIAEEGKEALEARKAFARILRTAGIDSPEKDPDALVEAFRKTSLPRRKIENIKHMLDGFRSKYAGSAFVRKNKDLLSSLFQAVREKVDPLANMNGAMAHQVEEARRKSGDVILVTPFGDRNTVSLAEVSRVARSGNIIRIMPGRYNENRVVFSNVNDITIEGVDEFIPSYIVFRFDSCDNVTIRGLNGYFPVEAFNSNITIIDSTLAALATASNNSKIKAYNSMIKELAGYSGECMINHCTMRVVRFIDTKRVEIENSIILGQLGPMSHRRDSIFECFRVWQGGKTRLLLKNCLVFSRGSMGILVKTPEDLWKREDIIKSFNNLASMKDYIETENCIEDRPRLENPHSRNFRLRSDSPGKGAATDLRDVGANLGPGGLPVPFK